jgi:hypothetical protein
MPLLPLWAFKACFRVNFTFTFRLERITAIHNIETPDGRGRTQKFMPGSLFG